MAKGETVVFKRKKYVTEQQLNHITNLIDSRIRSIEIRSYGNPSESNYAYDKIVKVLVEAGILVENTEDPKPTVRWQGSKYNVRKVK